MSAPEGEAEGRLRDQVELVNAAHDVAELRAELNRRVALVVRLARRLAPDAASLSDEEALAVAYPAATTAVLDGQRSLAAAGA